MSTLDNTTLQYAEDHKTDTSLYTGSRAGGKQKHIKGIHMIINRISSKATSQKYGIWCDGNYPQLTGSLSRFPLNNYLKWRGATGIRCIMDRSAKLKDHSKLTPFLLIDKWDIIGCGGFGVSGMLGQQDNSGYIKHDISDTHVENRRYEVKPGGWECTLDVMECWYADIDMSW